jgi:hypothetical protein
MKMLTRSTLLTTQRITISTHRPRIDWILEKHYRDDAWLGANSELTHLMPTLTAVRSVYPILRKILTDVGDAMIILSLLLVIIISLEGIK